MNLAISYIGILYCICSLPRLVYISLIHICHSDEECALYGFINYQVKVPN